MYTFVLAQAIAVASAAEPTAPNADGFGALAPPTADAPKPAPSSRQGAPQEQAVTAFQVRGTAPGNQVRLDTTVAPFYNPKTTAGSVETVSMLSASLRLARPFAIQARFGVVHVDPISSGSAASGITNATIGGQFGTRFARYFRAAASFGLGLPVGSGAGNSPNPDVAAAMKSASLARACMDNTMFTPNDMGFPVGADLAFVKGRFTAQMELNLIPSVRVQGSGKSPDASKLNFTSALFAGWFVVPERLSVGAELKNQAFVSTPVAVQKDASQRDNLSASGGVRVYLPVTPTVQMRPGISYGAGLYGPIADAHYQMVQVDVPVTF